MRLENHSDRLFDKLLKLKSFTTILTLEIKKRSEKLQNNGKVLCNFEFTKKCESN